MIRILFYALIIYLGYRFFKSMVGLHPPEESHDKPAEAQEAELEKDPQCGTYFLKKNGVRAVADGKELFFCSHQCRDQYIQGHRRS